MSNRVIQLRYFDEYLSKELQDMRQFRPWINPLENGALSGRVGEWTGVR